jgi:hypothetical protein
MIYMMDIVLKQQIIVGGKKTGGCKTNNNGLTKTKTLVTNEKIILWPPINNGNKWPNEPGGQIILQYAII